MENTTSERNNRKLFGMLSNEGVAATRSPAGNVQISERSFDWSHSLKTICFVPYLDVEIK